MSAAREMAQKIIEGQLKADKEFHEGIALWLWIQTGLLVIVVTFLVLNFATNGVAWAIAGLGVAVTNIVIIYWTSSRLKKHTCTLPVKKPKA